MASISKGDKGASHCLSLAGELNIYSAATVRQELLQALESQPLLEIDLAGIEDFDTCGVQLLLVLKREAVRQQKALSFVLHSAPVLEVLNLLNLMDEIGDSVLLPLNQEEGLQ